METKPAIPSIHTILFNLSTLQYEFATKNNGKHIRIQNAALNLRTVDNFPFINTLKKTGIQSMHVRTAINFGGIIVFSGAHSLADAGPRIIELQTHRAIRYC
jgi:hypothetical protein